METCDTCTPFTITSNSISPHPTWDITDASKLNEYMMCPRRFFYRYILGWDSEYKSHDLEFGTAWHLAMEYLLLNGYGMDQINEAFILFKSHYETHFPVDMQAELAPKTSSGAYLALGMYVANYQLIDNFNVLYTEVSGSISVLKDRVMHFRIDSINEDDRGVFSLEHKTTKTLERTFQDKWSLDVQPNLYAHVINCLFPDKNVYGVIINGTCLHKQGPRAKKPPAEFLRVPVRRTPEMMNAWLHSMDIWLDRLEDDYDKLSHSSDSDLCMKAFPHNGTACTDFWGCRYHDFCISWANPIQYAGDVPSGFITKYWDPSNPEDAGQKPKFEVQDNTLVKVGER